MSRIISSQSAPLGQLKQINMRVLNLWSLAVFVAEAASLKTEQKRVADIPTGNVNAATNRYIVEVETVCYAIAAFSLHTKLQTNT